MADKEDYEVGYGKPPCSGRFRKGQSGNVTGRPKGSKNLATIVLKESRQKVRVNGPGGTRMLSKLEAAVVQMSNKSAQGDLRASRELFALVMRSEETAANGAEVVQVSEADREIMENLKRRLKGFRTEGETSKKDEV